MTYKDFTKDLKRRDFHNVVFLHGRESFLLRWAADALCKAFAGAEFRDENVREFDGDSVSMDEIISMAKTPSMFPGERVLIVRNLPWLCKRTPDSTIKGEGARLLDYAGQADHGSLLVLTLDPDFADTGRLTAYGGKIQKAASSYEFNALTKPELRAFISKRVKKAGKYIGSRQMEYLIDLSGYLNRDSAYTLDELDNDLRKILLAAEGDEITTPLIEDLLIGDSDRFVFSLVDVLMAGNKSRAMQMTENILSSDDGNSMQILALLTSQFEMMYDALAMERKGVLVSGMVKALGVNQYRFRKAYAAAGKFRREHLKELLISLYNFDKQIKTGDIDKDTALELFILQV